jgi:hypothetical protein
MVTYAAGFAGGGANDVAYFRSGNNGATWPVGPIRVNDNLENAALGLVSDQFFPHISAPKDDPAGRLNATWYDRRNDQGSLPSSNLLIDVFHSDSVDGGLNWNVNGEVTDVSFPALPIPLNNAGNAFCYWGDYIGHAAESRGDRIYAAWGDDRRGQIDTFFAILHNTQNIRVNGDLDFGAVCSEDTQSGLMQIFNTGDLNLVVSAVSLLPGSSGDLSVDPNPQLPVTISPDGEVDFTVRCTPGTPGV